MITKRAIRTLALLVGAVLAGSHAAAQSAEDLVGTWSIESVTYDQGGTEVLPYGADPKGILVFDENGRYAVIVLRSDLPAFGSNNRVEGTADENSAVVQGSIAHFGTYSVEADSTLIFRVESATFPNWNEAEQQRPFTLSGNRLEYTVPEASGGGRGRVSWTRAE